MTPRELIAYFKTIRAERVDLATVPEQYREAVSIYKLNYNDEGNPGFGAFARQKALAATMNAMYDKMESERKGNCPRCSGRGFIQSYAHIEDGRCFKCSGTGSVKS